MDSFPETTSQLFNCLQISAEYIRKSLPPAEVAIVLGSGLSEFYKRLENQKILPFSSIPFMPVTTVKGHVSLLYHGFIGSVPVYLWGGRLHGYEGYANYQISYIANLSAMLSCHTLLVTNASGSAIKGSRPGDIILVKDHINHFCKNPLDSYLHTTFSELHCQLTYDREIIEFAKSLIDENSKFKVHEGTYFWVRGPCFETAYEVESYHKLGGDLFGMSTVPEVLAAQAHGMRMLVTAVASNLASGLCDAPLTHDLVFQNIVAVQKDVEEFFIKIITGMPPYKGKILNQWTQPICQNTLNRARIELDERDVRIAAEWIKKVETGRPQIQKLIVANCSNIFQLANMRRFLLNDIPQIILTSHSGKLSEIIIGDYEGIRVAVILSHTLEGINIYETYFLLRVFDSLRVHNVHYIFPAFTEIDKGGVADYLGFRLHGRACWPKFEASQITSTGEHFILAFAGPSIPSNAEFRMCEKINFIPTVANMAILSSACCLGLQHSASFYGSSELKELSLDLFSLALHSQHGEFDRKYVPELRGIMHTPSSPTALEELAESCAKYEAKIAFVATKSKVSKFFTILDTLSFDKLPYKLYFTKEKVLIIEGSPLLLHEDNHTEMMYPYFLSNLLGIQTVVILDNHTPLEDTDNWIRVTKHCGLAFFNPLFGKNIDKWGTRFPDMAPCYVYDPNWREDLAEIGINYIDGGVIFTNTERPIIGKALLNVAKFIEASGVVTDGVYPAIISQHKLEHQASRKVAYFTAPKCISDGQLARFSELVKKLVI